MLNLLNMVIFLTNIVLFYVFTENGIYLKRINFNS